MTPGRTPPTKPGLYWAKWRIASPGTDNNGEGCSGAAAHWEVVEVWENTLDSRDEEYLRVLVVGIARSQSIGNFFWGPRLLHSPTEG